MLSGTHWAVTSAPPSPLHSPAARGPWTVKLAKGHALVQGQARTCRSEQTGVGGQEGVSVCRRLDTAQLKSPAVSVTTKSRAHRTLFPKYKTDSDGPCAVSGASTVAINMESGS